MSTVATTLLLDEIDPRTRLDLIRARRLGMNGRLETASSLLDDKVDACSGTGRSLDAVALAMLKAELLHLDSQDAKAIEVFNNAVWPRLQDLPVDVGFAVEHNRSDIEFGLWSPTSGTTFYQLIDRQTLAGFRLSDSYEVAAAEEAVAEGKHNEALAAIWRELTRTYRQACWRPIRWATRRMARECLAIGLPDEAAYHAVIAQDDKLAKKAAEHLLAQRDVQAIRRTVTKLLSAANLQRHFRTACEVLHHVGDGIPDDQVDAVATWLLPRFSLIPTDNEAATTMRSAWKALSPIAARLSPSRAKQATAAALNHPYWKTLPDRPNTIYPAREEMVEAVGQLLYALPSEDLDMLARQTVPLARERMQNHDFPKVIDLLCRIAERDGGIVKAWIGDQLFAPGQPVSYLVLQVASSFGKPFLPPDRMATNADQIARNIRLQVQRLSASQEAEVVSGTIMTHTSPIHGGRIVVSVAQGVELVAMARHRKAIPPDALSRLVESVLAVISDQENLLTNRAAMIHGLMDFDDCLTKSLAEKALVILAPLARGQIVEPSTISPAAAANDPLNPNKIRMGTPAEVRGIALWALTRIGKFWPDIYGRKVLSILKDALSDLEPEVRRFAFAAAREVAKLSEAALMAVLQGTRDPDPMAAASAFAALATKANLRLTRSQWQQLVYAAKMASQSSAQPLRRTAAGALSRLIKRAPRGTIQSKASELLQSFSLDLCASVRNAASEVDEF
jgi:hypothetical protein